MPRDEVPAWVAVPLALVLAARVIWIHRDWWAVRLGFKEEQK